MTVMRTPEQELARFRGRLAVAGVVALVCFGLLAARFFYLQVMRYDYYSTRAEDNRISLVPIVPNRGLITDRHGTVLARNYSAYTLEVTPSKVADLDATIEELSKLVDIQPKDRKRLKKLMDESKSFESLPLRNRLSDEEVARFIAQRYRFPGVELKARLFRDYPLGSFASHVIGYIGRINDKDLERIEESDDSANYRGTDHIGKSGLEKSYERDLHGITGFEEVEVDSGGRAVRLLRRTPAIPGNNVVLTLDLKLQEIVEKAFGNRRGALVAIEPASGGVLAMVSTPTFDPNLFVDGIAPQDWDQLNTDQDKPLLNRAIYSAYPPGSTFKPFMALGALTTGKRTPGQTLADPGYFNYGGHRFMDDKVGGHGGVDMYKSIVVSCNTYYYVLANDMGIESIANFMRPLGFGQRSGIDLPGEAEGVLPSPEWKKRRFKRPEQQKWFGGETISVGIGQGYNAYTPLQMAQALGAVVNNGVLYRPHIARHVVDAKTGEKRTVEPEPLRTIPFKQSHIDLIKRAMVGVNKAGTGSRAFAGAPYEVGGKTGTAQVYSLKGGKYVEGRVAERLRDHSWFIAFAPADKPVIALAVLVENGGFGAQSAAPIARQALDYYLLGKVPAGIAAEDPAAEESAE